MNMTEDDDDAIEQQIEMELNALPEPDLNEKNLENGEQPENTASVSAKPPVEEKLPHPVESLTQLEKKLTTRTKGFEKQLEECSALLSAVEVNITSAPKEVDYAEMAKVYGQDEQTLRAEIMQLINEDEDQMLLNETIEATNEYQYIASCEPADHAHEIELPEREKVCGADEVEVLPSATSASPQETNGDTAVKAIELLEKKAEADLNLMQKRQLKLAHKAQREYAELKKSMQHADGQVATQRMARKKTIEEEKLNVETAKIKLDTDLSKVLAFEQLKFDQYLKDFEVKIYELEKETQDERSKIKVERNKQNETNFRRKCEAAVTIQAHFRGHRVRAAHGVTVKKRVQAKLQALKEERLAAAEARIIKIEEKKRRQEEETQRQKDLEKAERERKEAEKKALEEQKKAEKLQQEQEVKKMKEAEERQKAEELKKLKEDEERKQAEKIRLAKEKVEQERLEAERKAQVEEERRITEETESKRKEEERLKAEREAEQKRLEEKRVAEEAERKKLEEQAKREMQEKKEAELRRKEAEEAERKRIELELAKKTEEVRKQQEYKQWMEERKLKSSTMDNGRNHSFSSAPSDAPSSQVSDDAMLAKMEERRLRWMQECTPWCKILTAAKNKVFLVRKTSKRPSSAAKSWSPLSEQTVIDQAAVCSISQVEAVQLENLPGCTLTTLSNCRRLKALAIRQSAVCHVDSLDNATGLLYASFNCNTIDGINLSSRSLVEMDLSGNSLSAIKGFESCINLRSLNLSKNKISRIANLGFHKRLHTLILSMNQLISSKGIGDCVTLQKIDISSNHLTSLDELDNLCLLRHLNANSNNLMEIPRLKNAVLLSSLSLEDNSISTLDGLSHCWLPSLEHVELSQNSLTTLQPLHGCFMLKIFNLSQNQLIDICNVVEGIKFCPSLINISIAGNPVAQNSSYREKLWASVKDAILIDGQSGKNTKDIPINSEFEQMCQHSSEIFKVLDAEHPLISSDDTNVDLLGKASLLVKYYDTSNAQAENIRDAHEFGNLSFNNVSLNATASTAKDLFEAKLSAASKPRMGGPTDNVSAVPVVTGEMTKPSGKDLFTAKLTATENKMESSHIMSGEEVSQQPSAKDLFEQRLREKLESTPLKVSSENLRIFQESKTPKPVSSPRADAIKRSVTYFMTNGDSNHHNKKDLDLAERAATKIQALWKGYSLRNRMLEAMNYARVPDDDDSSEEMAEIDLSTFEFDVDGDWLPTETPQLPQKHAVLPPKIDFSKHAQSPHSDYLDITPHPPSGPRHAWRPSPLALPPGSAMSGEITQRSKQSKKEEEIADDWGFKDAQTAELMLQRAKKLKYNAQKRKKMSKLDPMERYDIQRRIQSTIEAPKVVAKPKLAPKKEYFKALEEEARRREHTKRAEKNTVIERTYEWLHSQYEPPEQESSAIIDTRTKPNRTGSGDSLPYLDQRVIGGGRTQLVGSPLEIHSVDSCAPSSAGTQRQPQAFSDYSYNGYDNEPVEASSKSHSASNRSKAKKAAQQMRRKEVEEFSAWGSGKKRSKH